MYNFEVKETYEGSNDYYFMYENGYIMYPVKEKSYEEMSQKERVKSLSKIIKYPRAIDLKEILEFIDSLNSTAFVSNNIIPSIKHYGKIIHVMDDLVARVVMIWENTRMGERKGMCIYPNYVYTTWVDYNFYIESYDIMLEYLKKLGFTEEKDTNIQLQLNNCRI